MFNKKARRSSDFLTKGTTWVRYSRRLCSWENVMGENDFYAHEVRFDILTQRVFFN